MRRFTDTDIWKKQWFQDLSPEYKMAWFYLKDNCDNVGVWSVNLKLANFQIGKEIDWNKFLSECNNNIKVLSENKWWLVDFCEFQYGELSQDSKSPPIISYIKLLNKHRLWKGYTKGIHTLKDKDKDKDLEKDKDKRHKYGEYFHVLLTDSECDKLQTTTNNAKEWIKKLDEYIQTTGKKYKDHYLTILNWYRKDNEKKEIRNPHVKSLTCPKCKWVITGPFCRKCGWIKE